MSAPAAPPIVRLLRPASVAVVGASTAANKMAGQVIPILMAGGYRGRVFPINPRYKEVGGWRCFPTLAAVPEPIDHCIVAVGKERVPDVLAECRALGVGSAAIFSSGYAETGEDGQSAQLALRDLAGDMPFIGPNCMGFANLVDRVIAAPSPTLAGEGGALGDIALLSQSGGLAYATVAWFANQGGLKFSYIVNTGNSAGISYTDLVEYMFADAATRVILVVAESENVVAQVVAAVRRSGLPKPIVLLKLGRGATGARMAMSHTGSLAGDYRLVRDIAEQHGIVCANDIDDALGAAALLRDGFTRANADGLAALSISGGNVTLFADQADQAGLTFAELAPRTEARLRQVLPDYISVHNPIDITALGYERPELHTEVLDVLVEDEAVRTLVPIITTAIDYTPVCSQLASIKARTDMPLIALWTGGSYETRSRDMLREARIPIFHSAGTLARSLDALRRAADPAAAGPAIAAVAAPALAAGTAPTESESMAFLGAAGVPVPRWRTCVRADLARTCEEVGYPVVVKADVAETHISDSGGVLLGVADAADLGRRAAALDRIGDRRLIVARFLPGHELIVSTFAHPSLGQVLMVGSGGRLTEMLKDVTFVALPAGREALATALRRTAIGRTLAEGFRGAAGFEPAVDLLARLAALAQGARERVVQIELNPVTVGSQGAFAVDAAIVAVDPLSPGKKG